MVPAAARGPLTFELDIDVCVIGGGLAGLTAAREIARRGWSVVVLEARRLAWNASGRNDGFVLPGFAESMDRVVARVGIDHAKALWRLSELGLDYVRTSIAEHACPASPRSPAGSRCPRSTKATRCGRPRALRPEDGRRDRGLADRARARRAQERPLFPCRPPAECLPHHPLNYALGLAEAAEAAGARIFEDSPALEIDMYGVRKRIVTPSARLRANHIVLACNVHLGSLVPRIAGTLIPVWACVMVTAPLGSRLEQAIGYRGAISDTELSNSHYRVVGGDRLMWSGPATAWETDPRRLVKAMTADIAANLSAARPGRGRACLVGRARQSAAPHAADRGAVAGAVARQRLRRPRHQYHCHGRRGDRAGDGRKRRHLAAVRAVRAGVGGRHAGRAAMQAYYWGFNARERFEARQARAREQEFRRGRQIAALRAGEEEAHVEARSARWCRGRSCRASRRSPSCRSIR